MALLVALSMGAIALASGRAVLSGTSQVTPPAKSLVMDVVDAWQGALIGGAKVQLLDKKGKVQFEGVSNERGRIEASGVPPGPYTLVITARGCNRFERKHFVVPTQRTFEADVTPSRDDD
jgi:carboxypeptidase family protein